MKARRHAAGAPSFEYIKMYDVANTRPIAGTESRFLPGPNQTRGLENNLIGIPNAAAKSLLATNQAPDKAQADTDDTFGNDNIDMVRDGMAIVVQRALGGACPQQTGDPNRDIVNYAYAYAKNLLLTAFQGISKPETQEAFCQGFTAGVAYSLGVVNAQAADYLSKALANRGKDSTIKQLIYQWFNEYVELLTDVEKEVVKMLNKTKNAPAPLKKVVEEELDEAVATDNLGIDIMSFDEFCDFMFGGNDNGIYEEQDDKISNEVLQESFFRFLDKMDLYD